MWSHGLEPLPYAPLSNALGTFARSTMTGSSMKSVTSGKLLPDELSTLASPVCLSVSADFDTVDVPVTAFRCGGIADPEDVVTGEVDVAAVHGLLYIIEVTCLCACVGKFPSSHGVKTGPLSTGCEVSCVDSHVGIAYCTVTDAVIHD